MKIKKDDNVIVLSGKDKGVTGKVLRAFPREDKVVVEGVNIRKRHKRPTKGGQKGQIIEIAHPIHVSNVRKADEVKKEVVKKEPKTVTAKKPAAKKTPKVKAE